MEVVIDHQVVPADLVENCTYVVIREEFEVFLDGEGGTLIRTERVLQVGAVSIASSRTLKVLKAISWTLGTTTTLTFYWVE